VADPLLRIPIAHCILANGTLWRCILPFDRGLFFLTTSDRRKMYSAILTNSIHLIPQP
jgi:hypothetical protein